MNGATERLARVGILAAGFGALWGAVHAFGLWGVPLALEFDQAISAAVNPDAYVPMLDEFFRGITDYTNLVVALPLISLAIAVGLYRLASMPKAQAARWALISCALWGGVSVLLSVLLDRPLTTGLALAIIAPVLIAVGALPCLVFSKLDPKRWLAGLLAVETVVMFGLWMSGMLYWNEGLPGVNFLLLPIMLAAFAAVVAAFYKLDDFRLSRYVRVFWLVLLSVLLAATLATSRTKDSIARPRPLSDAYTPWNEVLRPIPEETLKGNSSYPSGHTSGTFALLTPLFWWVRGRRARGAIFGLCVLQGVSRIYTVAHFFTDVLMGGLLGFGTGTLVFFLLGGPALRASEPDSAKATT